MIRDTRTAPWCWQEKNALRLIRKNFREEKGNTLAFAIAIYNSLTEMASDKQTNIFAAAQSEISLRTGISRKTVGHIIEKLELLGLITKTKRRDERGFLIDCEYCIHQAPAEEIQTAKSSEFNYEKPVPCVAYSGISSSVTQHIEESIEETLFKNKNEKATAENFVDNSQSQKISNANDSNSKEPISFSDIRAAIKEAANQGSLFAQEYLEWIHEAYTSENAKVESNIEPNQENAPNEPVSCLSPQMQTLRDEIRAAKAKLTVEANEKQNKHENFSPIT